MLTPEHIEKMRLGRAKSYEKLRQFKQAEKEREKKIAKAVKEARERKPKQSKESKESKDTKETKEIKTTPELFVQEKEEKEPKTNCCDNPDNWCWLDANDYREREAIKLGYTEVCSKCYNLK